MVAFPPALTYTYPAVATLWGRLLPLISLPIHCQARGRIMPRSRISPRASAIIAITLTLLISSQSVEAQQATGDVKPHETKPVEQRSK